MNQASTGRLSHVHPLLAKKVRALIDSMAKQGIQLEVVQGLRTFAEQDALFAQGRTKPGHIVTNARGGQSNHNYGLAVDLCPFKNGQPQWNDEHAFNAIGPEATKVGLEWGGSWHHLVDKPHVQLPGLSVLECYGLYRQGGLPLVWSEAERHIKSL